MNIVIAKAALALALTAAMLVAHTLLRDDSRAQRWSRWLGLPALWLGTRLLPWVVLYFVLGQSPQSDVATAYWPHAQAILHGAIPYRDFECFFSPLFPYLLALPALVWPDPRGIVLFLAVLELLAVVLTLRAARLLPGTAARTRWLTIYYLAPGPLLLAIVGGQDDFLFWLFGLAGWIVLSGQRDFLAGIVGLVGALFTKPLALIPLVTVGAASRRPVRYLMGFAPLSLVVIFVLWQLTGREFLRVLSQGANISPPNLWIWLHWLSGGWIRLDLPGQSLAMVALTCGFGMALFHRHRDAIRASFTHFFAAWTVVFCVFMFISLKSLGAYVGYFLLPASVLFVGQTAPLPLACWTLLGAIAPVECSLWFRLGEPLLTGWPSRPLIWLEYGLQAVMLLCLFIIARAAWRHLRTAPIA